jgi:hypothetical protein
MLVPCTTISIFIIMSLFLAFKYSSTDFYYEVVNIMHSENEVGTVTSEILAQIIRIVFITIYSICHLNFRQVF